MSEIHLVAERTLECSAATAWAVVADYDHDPRWRQGVVTMAPRPTGIAQPGTTTAEELRFLGRTWHNDGEVTAVDPGRQLWWRTVRGADARGSRLVEPVDDGRCLVRLELVVQPHGVEQLLRPVLARSLHRTLVGDLTRLEALVAQPAHALAGAAGR